MWLGCFQDLCFTNKVTFFKKCKMYQASKVGFRIPIKQCLLLSKCSSRKEVKKRLQMRGWRAVTTNGSFALSALSALSGSSLAKTSANTIYLEPAAGTSFISTHTLSESGKVLLQKPWGFQSSPWITRFPYLYFLLSQHLCPRSRLSFPLNDPFAIFLSFWFFLSS